MTPAERAFLELEKMGIGVPLGPAWTEEEWAALPKAEPGFAEKLAKIQASVVPLRTKRRKAAKPGGGRKSAFCRALASRGFTLRDAENEIDCEPIDTDTATLGPWMVVFSDEGWMLFNKKTERACEPYGAGSIRIIDRITK